MDYCHDSKRYLSDVTDGFRCDYTVPHSTTSAWRPHYVETFSALLALCEGNPPLTGGFPSQRPVARSFDVFFDLHLDKRLSKQSIRRWFETPSRSLWRHCNGQVCFVSILRSFAVLEYVIEFLNMLLDHSNNNLICWVNIYLYRERETDRQTVPNTYRKRSAVKHGHFSMKVLAIGTT